MTAAGGRSQDRKSSIADAPGENKASNTLFCSWKNVSGCAVLLIFGLGPLIVALGFLLASRVEVNLRYKMRYGDGMVYSPDGRKIYRTVFFGDSLIDESDKSTGFITKIVNALSLRWPTVAFDAVSAGHGGNTVLSLLKRVYKDVIPHNPDCVIVYFESDATDLPEAAQPEVISIYKANMRRLLDILTRQSGRCVGLGGPTIFGELPRNSGLNLRDGIMDTYVAANEQVAREFNVTYWHTRDAFFAQIPSWWKMPSGWLTLDGEHHNPSGVKIIQDFFQSFLVSRFTCILGPSKTVAN
jgi:hypothetical protein